ncbi:uncharacterized protein LOC131152950 [Malania oleifera]|uniref:uncharacterized protein LOC131152950 n=1 Tax=Malania oleifera TaxID=397392 RepID=UPI0025AE083E|nr:uncharacterized protein LOC131152950 [Malania oleifera]
MEDQVSKKRVRDESESDSAEVKRLRDDLLGLLDDSDPGAETQELDSVMMSFAQEILATSEAAVAPSSGESQPELGYLLEASDDELGLPPSGESPSGQGGKNEETESDRVTYDSVGLGELWGFGDEIPSYDSFELGNGESNDDNNGGEYVALGGLFDYSDMGFGSYEFSDLTWRPETLPAL